MTSDEDCIFCSERQDPSLIKEWMPNWPHQNRIIYQDNGMIAIPGLGPVVPGVPYVLLIPKTCRSSFLGTSAEEKDVIFDFLDRIIKLQHLFPYGKALVFEHGGGTSSPGCSCVEHCHLHVMNVVGKWATLPKLLKDKYPEARDVEITTAEMPEKRSYLFAGYYGLKTRTLVGQMCFPTEREPQILRFLIGQVTRNEWNYKLGENNGTMLGTYEHMLEQLKH